jgi:hypothetical protein
MAQVEIKAAMMIGTGPRVFLDGVKIGRIEKRGPYGARKWRFLADDNFAENNPVPEADFNTEAEATAHVEKYLK